MTSLPTIHHGSAPELLPVMCELAYPGATYIDDSAKAKQWSNRLGKPMHEVLIETNGHSLDLVFHDLIVRELHPGDKEWVE